VRGLVAIAANVSVIKKPFNAIDGSFNNWLTLLKSLSTGGVDRHSAG
jgi:hypothetical protein